MSMVLWQKISIYTGYSPLFNWCSTHTLSLCIPSPTQSKILISGSVFLNSQKTCDVFLNILQEIWKGAHLLTAFHHLPLKATRKCCPFQPQILTKTVTTSRYCLQKDLREGRPRGSYFWSLLISVSSFFRLCHRNQLQERKRYITESREHGSHSGAKGGQPAKCPQTQSFHFHLGFLAARWG